MLTPGRAATLALLLEATSDPTPGNVDRGHDHGDTALHQFVGSAVAVGPALAPAAEGAPLGATVEEAAAASGRHRGGNTHFGAILLLAPLVAGAGAGDPVDGAEGAVEATTVEDAERFYAAFDHVEVALPPIAETDVDPALDARDPRAARAAVRDRGLTLADLMAAGAEDDGIAREWTEGFPATADAADRLERHHDPAAVDGVEQAVVATHLALLADRPDGHVATVHGRDVAEQVRDRAAAVRDDDGDLAAFDAELVERGINPGTTADIVAGGLYLALRRDGGFRP